MGQTLIPTFADTGANVTNLCQDSYLALLNPALTQKMAVNLRATHYLGPQLFESGLVYLAQELLIQRIAAKG
jgi:hypothetical protein